MHLNRNFLGAFFFVIASYYPPDAFKVGTRTYWRKSSFSTYNGNCIEVGHRGRNYIGVRDTKDLGKGSILSFTRNEWDAFLGELKDK